MQYVRIHIPWAGNPQTERSQLQRFSPSIKQFKPHTGLHSLGGLATRRQAVRTSNFESQWGLHMGEWEAYRKQRLCKRVQTKIICTLSLNIEAVNEKQPHSDTSESFFERQEPTGNPSEDILNPGSSHLGESFNHEDIGAGALESSH